MRKGVTLCKKQTELRTSEADLEAVEAREDCWSISGEFIYRHHVRPREHLYLPKESSFPILFEYTDVVRQTKTNLDNLEESSIDGLWHIGGNRILSENWSGSTRFRILNKRPHQGSSRVDDRLTNAQITSRPETI